MARIRPKKNIEFLKTISFSIKWLFRYSGLEFIYRKFNPPQNPQTLPTGFIWLIGIYVIFFGVASQKYENRIEIIENRANSIFFQLAVPSAEKKALSRIPRVQNMTCPYKPNILNPFSVFSSLFRDSKYGEVSALLKETIEDWKDSLDSVNLSEAILREANLRQANFQGADLSKADLQEAILQEADLQNANFRGANLQRADLRRANLQEASLREADLQNANLRGTNLQRADLWKTDLQETDFQNANLRGVNLQEADFQGSNLRGASLQDADLGGAKELTVEQLCKASVLYEAKLGQELQSQIKHDCSDLLKKPQTTKENTSGEKK